MKVLIIFLQTLSKNWIPIKFRKVLFWNKLLMNYFKLLAHYRWSIPTRCGNMLVSQWGSINICGTGVVMVGILNPNVFPEPQPDDQGHQAGRLHAWPAWRLQHNGFDEDQQAVRMLRHIRRRNRCSQPDDDSEAHGRKMRRYSRVSIGQSYKHFTLVNYDSRAALTRKMPIFMENFSSRRWTTVMPCGKSFKKLCFYCWSQKHLSSWTE